MGTWSPATFGASRLNTDIQIDSARWPAVDRDATLDRTSVEDCCKAEKSSSERADALVVSLPEDERSSAASVRRTAER